MLWKRLKDQAALSVIIRICPLVFLIHDLEELFVMEAWLKTHRTAIAEKWGINGVPWTTPRFALAVLVLFIVIYWASRRALKTPSTSVDRVGYLTVLAGLFLNGFTHTAQSFVMKEYTPGVITVMLLVWPYTVYALYRLRRENWISRRFIWIIYVLGPLAFVAVAAVTPLIN